MKKIIIIALLLTTKSSLLACGCWDSGLADQGAEATNELFDNADEKGGDIIAKIKRQTIHIKELETDNIDLLKKIFLTQSYNDTLQREILFTKTKKNYFLWEQKQ